MANRVMNQTSGAPRLSGHSKVIRLLVAALAVALVLLAASQIRRDTPAVEQGREAVLSAPVSAPSQTFSTEQYWQMAAELDAKTAAPAAEQPAYFTEQYWKMAEETKTSPAPEPEWSYYTERYWSLSEE